MTFADDVLDDAWLSRTKRRLIQIDEGLALHLATLDGENDQWLVLSARWTATDACKLIDQEARLAGRLDAAWARKPLGLIRSAESLSLVYADDARRPLRSRFADTVSIGTFLSIACAAATALGHAHAAGLIHHVVTPTNLLIAADDSIRLTGFGSSVLLGDPAVLPVWRDHVLPYAAPESGRRSCAPDHRSDLYSLGVTLYELLTRRLPLAAGSSAEWRHAHAAIAAERPELARSDVPAMLAEVLLKLLAKDPAERYQSSAALHADLAQCRAEWHAGGTIGRFELGRADAYVVGERNQALVGRDPQIAALDRAIGRVTDTGRSELVLIAGAAGIGKSALVGALPASQPPLRYSAQGKAEQLQSTAPYSPLAQALRTLTLQLISRDQDEVDRVRTALLAGLGGHGRLIVDLVPETELLIGAQPALGELPAPQALARIHTALTQSFAAFAQDGSPLLLFLDDLQWVDEASETFLRKLLSKLPANILLVIAHRDEADHQLDAIQAVRVCAEEAQVPLTGLVLRPLSVDDVTALLETVLHGVSDRVAPLAGRIHEKTGGNPFFVSQLLRTLIDDQVIRHDRQLLAWEWDLAAVEAHQYSDNVIDLMVRRLHRLPAATVSILRQMAYVGSRCDDALLLAVTGLDEPSLRAAAQSAEEAGLLNRDETGYSFAHDRVLETAYALTPADERALHHARVANIMIRAAHDRLGERAFDIAGQIERADRAALSREETTAFVAALTLAAQKARGAAALDRAVDYLTAAIALLGANAWEERYALTYGTSLFLCECHLANAKLAAAKTAIGALIEHAQGPIDQARGFRLRATLETVQSNYDRAIGSALAGLALLGIDLPHDPSPADLAAAYDAVQQRLGDRRVQDLVALPVARNETIEVAMDLLATLISSFFIEGGLAFLHLAKIVELTLEHGIFPACPYGLAWFGVYVAHIYGAYVEGRAYAEVALAIVDRHGYEAGRMSTLVALDQVLPWTAPLPAALAYAREGVSTGRAAGDLGMACYACNHLVSDLIVMGEHLPLLEREIERGFALTREIGYVDVEQIIAAQHGLVRSLRYGTDPLAFAGPAEQPVADHEGRLISRPTLFWQALYAGMRDVYLGQFESAAAWLAHAESWLWSLPAHIDVANYHLFRAIADAHAGPMPGQAEALAAHSQRLSQWAALNPRTFRSKALIVEAELARLRGQASDAIALYDRAARTALAGGFVHEQALVHDLAGRLCAEAGMTTAAHEHFRRSRDAYRAWGADAMVHLLEERHPALAVDASGSAAVVGAAGESALDLAVAIEAAQALSEEIVLDRLVETLMKHMIVHAGARQGMLLLMRDGTPQIEAVGRVVDREVAVTRASGQPSEQKMPSAILNTVLRTKKIFISGEEFDPMRPQGARSVLCLPLVKRGELIGLLYLENDLAPGVFTPARTNLLEILAAQAAISLTTAALYAELLEENALRERTEASLRTARAELAKTSHLTVMGGLAASIAHEINQPLSVIVANAGAALRWLKRDVPDLPEALASLDSIRQDGLRAANIVKGLRALAKQAPLVLVPTDVDALIREVLRLTATEIEAKHVQVVTALDTEEALVPADPVQLQQVLVNLIINAAEAMETEPERKLFITSQRKPDAIVVRIRDTGPGLNTDDPDRIFQAFFTTKPNGMGMGLAICRSIIEAHAGKLEAQSTPEGGTSFQFSLPLVTAAA